MPHRTDFAIGVDVGGTRIRSARIGPEGKVRSHKSEPVEVDRRGFSEQVLRMIESVRDETCQAVGIGIPGRVKGDTGEILSAGYLDIAHLNLREQISAATGLPVQIENDATMALIAEAHVRRNGTDGVIIMVTIGTGIGGAILENGEPWYGGGISGQFGHIVVADTGPVCNCGRRGCVETFSSGTALGGLTARAGLGEVRAHDLIKAADSGDETAKSVLGTWAEPLARAIATLVAVADPDRIIIGGGLGAEMTQALARLPRHEGWYSTTVEPAILGDRAGVVGAGLCAMRAFADRNHKGPNR